MKTLRRRSPSLPVATTIALVLAATCDRPAMARSGEAELGGAWEPAGEAPTPSEEDGPSPEDPPAADAIPTEEEPESEVDESIEPTEEVPPDDPADVTEQDTDEVLDEVSEPAQEDEEDDWGDEEEEEDWGEEDEEDDWDGQVLIEDASDDPNAELEEQVEQVEVKGASGELRGVVKDARTGDPLMGANVRVLNSPYEVTTDGDGAYVLRLPEGIYTVEFFYETFSVKEIADLEVEVDGSRTQSVELVPLAGMVSETVIEAEAPKGNESVVLTERAEAVETKDVMSSQEMKKAGGGSSASLARFIVGATLEDNRYLIIRGLKHRYGNTLFDGARLPSPDPDVRTVPLDIFPSGALSSIDIVKSFTPEQPADFVGGSTQLRSRDIPDEFTFDVSASFEANTQATFDDFVRDGRLRGDGVGFGNISRGLPTGFPGTSSPPVAGPAYAPEEIEAYGEALYTATPSASSVAPPTYRLSTTLGNGHTLANGDRVGWVLSGGIKDEFKTVEGVSASAIDCRGCPNTDAGMSSTVADESGLKAGTDWGSTDKGSDRRYVRRVQLGGIGLAKYTSERGHEVFANMFYSRDAANEVRYQRGFSPKAIGPEAALTSRHRYVMRSIFFTQVGAAHEFEKARGLKLDYSGSFSRARQDDPTRREVLYTDTSGEGNYEVAVDVAKPRINAGVLDDAVGNGVMNLEFPFRQWLQLDSSVKMGAWVEGKQREFSNRRFLFQQANGVSNVPDYVGNVLNADTIGGGLGAAVGGQEPFYLVEQTGDADGYEGRQQVFAGYGQMDLPITRWFKITGGVRYEFSKIAMRPFNPFDRENQDLETFNTTDSDVFPAASLIFSPTSKMNIRLGGTRTIARPEMRELAPFSFTKSFGGVTSEGFDLLESTRVWNADLRWEWFPSGGEVVAVSAFFKQFDKPIEAVLTSGTSSELQSWVNSQSAINIGGEAEFKKNLGFLGRDRDEDLMKPKLRWLEDISVGANFAYIFSRVTPVRDYTAVDGNTYVVGENFEGECPPEDRLCRHYLQYSAAGSQKRPLAGVSPWILNAFIDYDNSTSGTRARVLYNAFGERLWRLSEFGNIWETPQHMLDLVMSQRLFQVASSTDSFEAETSQELRVTLRVGNILNTKFGVVQRLTDETVSEIKANQIANGIANPDVVQEIDRNNFRKGVDVRLGLSYSF